MSLANIRPSIVLDIYDHNLTPSSIKTIALDSNTRFVAAVIRNRGEIYDIGQDAAVALTVVRPDKTRVQITGQTYSLTETTRDDETITYYGASAELTQLALAIKGNLRAQFKITSGEQELRTEIFTINNGEALDAGDGDWAGDLDGHNLDEMAQSIEDLSSDVSEIQEDVGDLKEGLNSIVVKREVAEKKTITADSEELSFYGRGAVSAINGRYTTDTTHDTFLWTPTKDTSLYIVRNTANFLRIIEYNDIMTTLPSSAANSYYVRGASYESEDNLPNENNQWILPAGHTIAISRANNSNYVTSFTLYYTQQAEKKALASDIEIQTDPIISSDVIRTLRDDFYRRSKLKWVHAEKTGTRVVISENNPINITFDITKLRNVDATNRFDIATRNFIFSSSTPNATITKTTTGVKVESSDTGGANKYIYFNYTAENAGRLWISCLASCLTQKINDCRMVVVVNGIESPPACVGVGELKRYVDVEVGDTVQIRLWYHLYVSPEANTVEYNDIMLCYADREYIKYTDGSINNIESGSALVFSESTTVEYDYTEWDNPIKCVCFGDSVTGMFDNGADYCSIIEKILPINCINVAFSGETWADHPSPHYVPFSINRLIDAIVSEDFTYQDEHISSITSDFYVKHLANLKSVDFSSVDVVTFLAGTNDWAFNIPLLSSDDVSTENKQRTNEQDAVNYCITQLLTKYPHLTVIILTPYWRNRANDEDSNVVPNSNGVYLYQFAETIQNCAKAQNVMCEELYWTLGANWMTRAYYTIDGTHPTSRTKQAIAERIKKRICESGIIVF